MMIMNKILFSGTIRLILIITAFFIPIEWVQKPIFLLGIISIYTLLRKRYTVMDYLHHPIPALVAIVIIFLLSLILLSGYNATIKIAGGIVLIVLLYKRFVHIKRFNY